MIDVSPRRLDESPGIDPREYAVEARAWGDEFTGYVVRHKGRWYAWFNLHVDDGEHIYELPEEQDARAFLDAQLAWLILTSGWGELIARASAGDLSERFLYSAEVRDGAEDGIWLAVSDGISGEEIYTLHRFASPAEAVETFSERTLNAASAIENADIGWPEIAAGQLRCIVAAARAGAERAALGDQIRARRGRIRAERALTRVAASAGVSREFLYRVMAGQEWTWSGLTPSRRNTPPGPQQRHSLPGSGSQRWRAWLRLGIEASEEAAARATFDQIMREAELTPAGDPQAAFTGQVWSVAADVAIPAGLRFEPDNAQARMGWVVGHLPHPTSGWVARVRELQGSYQWPPPAWDRPPGDQFGHPDVRAANIHISSERT
jgi:hypothetical protein